MVKSRQQEIADEIMGIQYNQSYENAMEMFKSLSREEILKLCQLKESDYISDLNRYSPKTHTGDEGLTIVLRGVEAKAFRDASKAIFKMGSIN